MSTHLHLTTADFSRMVELGAFDHLNRKIELIRGEIREMNPAGPVHDDLIAFLIDWSVRSTDRGSVRVTAQTGLELTELESRPEPDVLWIRADRYFQRHPTANDVRLAVEVSDSSLNVDLMEKAALYAAAGIVEYWIVDVQRKCIHVHRSPVSGEYQDRSIVDIHQSLLPLADCNFALDLRELFGE